jgi:hypothetical protein
MVARQMEFLRHGFWTAAPIILARTHPVVGAVATTPAGSRWLLIFEDWTYFFFKMLQDATRC